MTDFTRVRVVDALQSCIKSLDECRRVIAFRADANLIVEAINSADNAMLTARALLIDLRINTRVEGAA